MAPARPPIASREADRGDAMPSPCIRQCCLDDADECVGCGRTLEEIKAWHAATDEERSRILGAAATRRDARARRFPGAR